MEPLSIGPDTAAGETSVPVGFDGGIAGQESQNHKIVMACRVKLVPSRFNAPADPDLDRAAVFGLHEIEQLLRGFARPLTASFPAMPKGWRQPQRDWHLGLFGRGPPPDSVSGKGPAIITLNAVNERDLGFASIFVAN